jgi:crotonobetainyl-CoA:carnitine CoA-transferase CaiB-like acyl-CoA transferase
MRKQRIVLEHHANAAIFRGHVDLAAADGFPRQQDAAGLGPFQAGDGKTVMLGLQNEREWVVFCKGVLQQPELATDPRFDSNARRNEHREALKAIILAAFSGMSIAEVTTRLDEAQIANARMNSMAELWAHPQLKARDRWRQVASPVGDIPALLPPGRINSFDYRMDPIPAVGQHTHAILRELGQGDDAVAALQQTNAI